MLYLAIVCYISTLTFLKRCRSTETIPVFLKLKCHIKTLKSKRILKRTSAALLRERIQATYRSLHSASEELYKIHFELSSIMNKEHWILIDNMTSNKAANTLQSCRRKQIKKFDRLHKKQLVPLTTRQNDRIYTY